MPIARFGVALLAIAATLVVEPRDGQLLAAAQQSRHVVYVTAVDAKGEPVITLSAADFAVKESGQDREVLSARLATASLHIAVILDDNGTGIFRYALANFVRVMQGQADIALSSVVVQTMKVVDYTRDTNKLIAAITRLGVRPGAPEGGQLLAGIYEAARDLKKREAVRPAIVVLTVGGLEHSSLDAHDVLEQLRQSGASLHVFATRRSALRQVVDPATAAGLLDENLNLAEVLGDGPKQSGGSRDDIVASTGLGAELQHLATQLLNQYEVAYVRPQGAKSTDRLNVTISRPSVIVRAPTRIPSR